MQEDQRLAVMVEAVFFESSVNALVDDASSILTHGGSREFILYDLTAMLLRELDTPGKIASIAAMSVVLLMEERRDDGDRPGQASDCDR